MDQAAINREMLPWGEAEFRRFAFRVGLFERRGMDPDAAEKLADLLALRDQRKDDRRVCDECSHLQLPGTCFAAAQGWMKNVSKRHQPVRGLLHRCEHFDWAKPQ